MEPRPRTATTLAIVGAVLIGLPACRTGAGGPDTIANDTGDKVTVRLLREPVDVPAFTVTDIEGKTTSSTDWRGKVVLVNFWATWCPPCRAEIPDLIKLQEKYRDKLVILGLSEDEEGIDVVRRYVADHKVNYPIAMSTPELRKLFPTVRALPTTFVLDRDGKMAQKNVGMLNARETEAGARVLAGLSANAEVVKVELNEKPVGVENAAAVKEIPGIDLGSVPAAKRTEVLLALNEE